jgi:hypothetical protein
MPQDRRLSRHRNRILRQDLPFRGIDGEGGDIDGSHEYLLLRAGEFVLDLGHPLNYWECLPFLCDLPKDRIWVSFFFDYDVTMMLRKLPRERLRRLLDVDCRRIPGRPCSSFPVDFGPYQIDYMPRKELRVRRRPPRGGKEPWTIIHDTGSFFQSSFVVALKRWFGETLDTGQWVPETPMIGHIIERIAEGKAQRNEFGAVTEYERQYNQLEIHMLERMMEKFRSMCNQLDIRPSKWQGPGNLVSAVFRQEKLPPNRAIALFDTHQDLMLLANAAYFGGRFEPPYFGEIPGPVYQYDLNSAYANTYRTLPCLVHGTWNAQKRLPAAGSGIYLAEVTFNHPPGMSLGTLPIRTQKGSLIFPMSGKGVYWSTELDIARKHGVALTPHKVYKYVNHCNCSHFDFVYRMYNLRKTLGKDGKGLVLKIILASTYGKLAQSVGCAPYSNPIWAGLIVSLVRAQLINAALQRDGGHDVLMLATDGMFTRQDRSLDTGPELGQWSVTKHESMFIVQSGVYFLPHKKPKTRGIPQSRVIEHEDDFRRVWAEFLAGKELHPVSIPLRVFIGLRLALQRNKPELAGQWIDMEDNDDGEHAAKKVTFDWSTKRVFTEIVDTYVRTGPIMGSPLLESVPYNRIIGGIRSAERLLTADQPDWGDTI